MAWSSAASSGIHYVSVLEHFEKHEACSPYSQDWVNDIKRSFVESFHPNIIGQGQYARLLRNHIIMQLLAQETTTRSSFSSLEPNRILTQRGADNLTRLPPPSEGKLHLMPSAPGCRSNNGAIDSGYVPGELLFANGEGFGPGEVVYLRITSRQGNVQEDVGTVVADPAGLIETQFRIPTDVPIPSGVILEALGRRTDGGAHLLRRIVEVTAPGTASDDDGDGIPSLCDNCPSNPNPSQLDTDQDGIGDACDLCPLDYENDVDHDGLCKQQDDCPFDAANDTDGDGICETNDNCQRDFNPDQTDSDRDGRGDTCAHKTCYSIDVATAPPDGGGVSITPPNCRSGEYEEGTGISIAAGGFDGYGFTGWTGAASGTSTPLRLTVNQDMQVTANFAPAAVPAPAPLLSAWALAAALTLISLVALIALRRQAARRIPEH